MKKIVFTLCSNNYLPQGLLLAESFLRHHADYLFIVGLVDKKNSGIRYPDLPNLQVVECEKVIDKEALSDMAAVYKIVELNTSVKPFYFNYLFAHYPEAEIVVYLDPDIYVYHPFTYIEELLTQNDIVLTPHCLTPLSPDGLKPSERSFLKYGIYNLGFIAVKRSSNSLQFVNWFSERLRSFCYAEVNQGMYVDQLWANLIPIFFAKVHVSRHPGLNCAYWNIQERQFASKIKDQYLVNNEYPLLFFHFSAVDVNNFKDISRSQDRYNLTVRPDLTTILESYADSLREKRNEQNYSIPCIYTKRSWKQKWNFYLNRYRIRKSLWV